MGDSDVIDVKSEEGKGSSFYFEINADMRSSFSLNTNEDDSHLQKIPGDLHSSIANVILNHSPYQQLLRSENPDAYLESQEQLNTQKPSLITTDIKNQLLTCNGISDKNETCKRFNFEEQSTLEYIDQKLYMNSSVTKASIFLRENNKCLKKSKTKEISDKKQMQLMIVDDSQFNIFSLKVNLRELSKEMQIDEFLDPRKALEAIKTKQYDVIITDIQMPIINGIQLVSQIRDMKDTIVQPSIVLISAGNEGYYEKEIKDLNIYSFINKPIVDKKGFKDLMNKLLKQSKVRSNNI